ncbi:SOCS box domain-containing protein, partial [Nephila pilipes]
QWLAKRGSSTVWLRLFYEMLSAGTEYYVLICLVREKEEVIPRTHRMILRMISSIRSVNLMVLRSLPMYNNGLCTAASNQKECFRLIWRAIPQSFIQCEELESSIEAENSLLAQNGVLRLKR